jgi:hypothetical protein
MKIGGFLFGGMKIMITFVKKNIRYGNSYDYCVCDCRIGDIVC